MNYNPYPFPHEGENTPGFQNVVYETKDGGKSPKYRVIILHCITTRLLQGWISVLPLI